MINNKRISIAARALAIGMVAALVLAGTALGEVSKTGLVAEYHFDGDAKDSSGNGNDGTIYGATFVEGVKGQALSFNGRNDYVDMGDVNDFKSQQFTISMWINPSVDLDSTTVPDYDHSVPLFFKTDSSQYATVDGFDLQYTYNERIVLGLARNFYSRDQVSAGNLKLPKNNWYNIVGTYDGTTGKLYLNGNVVNTNQLGITITYGSGNVKIGKALYGSNYRYFRGLIDEVLIYNRALSASEIKANYEASKSPPAPQLTLTKSLSPSTITEGDSTTVTLRVENTGGDAKSVKITDTIPQGFTLVSGSASKEYAALKATESRTFQYTIKATGTGRFVSDLATVTYQDEKGNSYSGASNSATITVQAGQAGQVSAAQPKTPGFGAILAGIGIILALALRRR